jgi:hypothetical protein
MKTTKKSFNTSTDTTKNEKNKPFDFTIFSNILSPV